MRLIVLVWASLACVGHGRRQQRAAVRTQSNLYGRHNHPTSHAVLKQWQARGDSRFRSPWRSLAAFLMLSIDPATCWAPGATSTRVLEEADARSATAATSHASPRRLLFPRHPSVKMPSVVYKVPQTDRKEWVKKYTPLYEQRMLYLGQEIEDPIICQLISTMLFMDAEDSQSPQHFYINSPGGSVIAGLALFDTWQHIGSPVITTNVGSAASMASFLLGAGVRGRRTALPGTQVMIHQPMAGVEGQATDLRVEAEQVYRIKETILNMYAEMTGKTREQIEQDLSFDNYMSSEEAMKYGLIDKIVEPRWLRLPSFFS